MWIRTESEVASGVSGEQRGRSLVDRPLNQSYSIGIYLQFVVNRCSFLLGGPSPSGIQTFYSFLCGFGFHFLSLSLCWFGSGLLLDLQNHRSQSLTDITVQDFTNNLIRHCALEQDA